MTTIEFLAFAFDAVAAFYSITHIPRDRRAPFLKMLAQWLRPGGWFSASFGAMALDDWVGNWLGTTMFSLDHCPETVKFLMSSAKD